MRPVPADKIPLYLRKQVTVQDSGQNMKILAEVSQGIQDINANIKALKDIPNLPDSPDTISLDALEQGQQDIIKRLDEVLTKKRNWKFNAKKVGLDEWEIIAVEIDKPASRSDQMLIFDMPKVIN